MAIGKNKYLWKTAGPASPPVIKIVHFYFNFLF